jgi:chemotaxis response regulator CheB
LLLTSSPLLREEVKRVLAGPPAGAGAVRLHICEPRERDYAQAMANHRPGVALVAVDDTPGKELRQSRELILVARLVQEWRVPTLVLGLATGEDATVEKAATRACRSVGAVGYLPRERWAGDDGSPLRAKLGAASRVKVLRPLAGSTGDLTPLREKRERPLLPTSKRGASIVVVGSSAGGPDALRELLRGLPPHLPAPLLFVQHIPPSFGPTLAHDLSRATNYRVQMVAMGDELQAGRGYLAPGRQALTIVGGSVTDMSDAEANGVHGQAIDRTMESVAACYGANAIGVILSGMGEDGVRGLRAIKERGGTTYGQDEASCHVYGMPRRAAELKLLDSTGPPAAIGAAIGRLFGLSTPLAAADAPAGDRAAVGAVRTS